VGPRWLFVLQVLAYAAFPIYFASLRSGMRLVFLYVYVGIVLTVGGFLGSVHGYPLTDGVTVSSGSVSYGALMMTAVVLVICGREVQVIRNAVRIVIVVNVFKVTLYEVTSRALRDDAFPNPFSTDPDVFAVSLRVVFVGGFLIVAELLLLVFVFERLKRAIRNRQLLHAGFVATFVVVLCLDGLAFPLAALSPNDLTFDVVQQGVHAKLLLALAYCVPLLGFLVAFRSSMATFEAVPLRLQELVFAPREDVLAELEVERAARRETERELAARTSLARALAQLDPAADVDRALEDLAVVLWRIPGVQPVPVGLAASFDRGDATELGRRAASRPPLPPVTADEPWAEQRGEEEIACVPVGGSQTDAVLEVWIEPGAADAVLPALHGASYQLATLLQPALARARGDWEARSPILDIIARGAITPVFQPIVSLVDRRTIGFEGLSRFEDGTSPDQRFAEAARLGLGTELEVLAIRLLLDAAAALPPGLPVSLNLSPETLLSGEACALVEGSERPLKVEITEHRRVADYDAVRAALERLRPARFVVDDAGSGYASLQHILRLHPDE
jgi:uncharacterized PurR-regulated membrane protein YhhQ (DUF165 family)